MKYFLAGLLLCAVVGGCSGSGGSNDSTNSSSDTTQYRFSINGCDTGPRYAISRDQLCRNLQFEAANNECASTKREEFFGEHCPGQTWNPEAVRQAINSAPGAHVNCYITDGENPTFTNHQYTIDPLTIIPHDNFVAVVTQSLSNGTIDVHVKLMTAYPGGNLNPERLVTRKLNRNVYA